jgi:succinoglycan biosynthesis protein ExoH
LPEKKCALLTAATKRLPQPASLHRFGLMPDKSMHRNSFDPDVATRIDLLRFVMIFGIVILHTPQYVNIADVGTGWFDLFKAFFQSAVFRCTVPVLTTISGYLLFKGELDRDSRKLVGKKIRSLAIPFLTCNGLLAAGLYLIQSEYKLPISYQLYPFNASIMLDGALGLTQGPVNYPLHFIRDLFILTLLSPLFGLLLRRAPFSGLLLLTVIFWFNFDGFLILRKEMPIMFYIGGLVAIKGWNVRRLDPHARLCFVLFLTLCASIIVLKIQNTTYLRLVSPLLVWPATSILSGTPAGKWLARRAKYSFFIFLLHAPVLLVSFMVYKQFLAFLPYEIYWFAAPFAVTGSLIAIYKYGMLYGSINFCRLFGIPAARLKLAAK